MKISILLENAVIQTNPKDVSSEHGLSLFIEFNDVRILFDLGQSNLFTQIDYLIISRCYGIKN
jgi:metal-dependent hydrolase (beta-lactamase superfamily II)